jgi:hypothetical protein
LLIANQRLRFAFNSIDHGNTTIRALDDAFVLCIAHSKRKNKTLSSNQCIKTHKSRCRCRKEPNYSGGYDTLTKYNLQLHEYYSFTTNGRELLAMILLSGRRSSKFEMLV